MCLKSGDTGSPVEVGRCSDPYQNDDKWKIADGRIVPVASSANVRWIVLPMRNNFPNLLLLLLLSQCLYYNVGDNAVKIGATCDDANAYVSIIPIDSEGSMVQNVPTNLQVSVPNYECRHYSNSSPALTHIWLKLFRASSRRVVYIVSCYHVKLIYDSFLLPAWTGNGSDDWKCRCQNLSNPPHRVAV